MELWGARGPGGSRLTLDWVSDMLGVGIESRDQFVG